MHKFKILGYQSIYTQTSNQTKELKPFLWKCKQYNLKTNANTFNVPLHSPPKQWKLHKKKYAFKGVLIFISFVRKFVLFNRIIICHVMIFQMVTCQDVIKLLLNKGKCRYIWTKSAAQNLEKWVGQYLNSILPVKRFIFYV